jgi:hypothetical protein
MHVYKYEVYGGHAEIKTICEICLKHLSEIILYVRAKSLKGTPRKLATAISENCYQPELNTCY